MESDTNAVTSKSYSSFNDTSIHIVSKLLVDFGSLSINSFVEWMPRPLETLMKVKERNLLHKSNTHYAAYLRHNAKPWVIYITPERVFQVPIRESMIERVEDRACEHSLAVYSWKQIFVLVKLVEECASKFHHRLLVGWTMFAAASKPLSREVLLLCTWVRHTNMRNEHILPELLEEEQQITKVVREVEHVGYAC